MNMNYIAKFGLEFDPFIKNSKDIIIKSTEYNEAMARLGILADIKGFGLLTGEPGRGKTTILRNWAASLNTSMYRVVYSSLSTLTVNDFYREMATGLGLMPSFRKNENFRMIQEEITRLALDKRRTPVFILDEANYIKNAILNELKMLFNFEMDSRDRAVVVLAGLPQLNSTLKLSSHEPLRQRLVMTYNLEGLTKEEGRIYIESKIKGAGCHLPVFGDNAVETLLNAANGTPRVLNRLCSAAMLIAGNAGCTEVNAEAAMKAINECELA